MKVHVSFFFRYFETYDWEKYVICGMYLDSEPCVLFCHVSGYSNDILLKLINLSFVDKRATSYYKTNCMSYDPCNGGSGMLIHYERVV